MKGPSRCQTQRTSDTKRAGGNPCRGLQRVLRRGGVPSFQPVGAGWACVREERPAARFVELLTEITRARELLASLGLERYGLQVKKLAEPLKKHPATATGWVMRGVRKRRSNPYFRVRYEELGRHLIGG